MQPIEQDDMHSRQSVKTAAFEGAIPALPLSQAPEAPRAIRDWFARLSDAGHPSHLVGECVLQLALGRRPNHYRAHSPISRERLLNLAPRAIPTRSEPAVVTLPTSAGPLDIVPDRRFDQTLLDLESADFAILALALDPLSSEWIAHDRSRDDIAARTLSPAANPRAPLAEGFALEAARLIAVYGLRPANDLLEVARKTPTHVAPPQPTGPRRALRELLLAPGVEAGLSFLRDSGAEERMVPGVRRDAAAIVARVSAEPRVRFGAWLQGADAKGLLRGLRFGEAFSSGHYRLLEHHPIDQWLAPERAASLRRLLKRLSPSEIADLLALRSAEAGVLRESKQHHEAEQLLGRLEHLERRIAQMHREQSERRARPPLAISSEQIMRTLACGPGPEVGRAIRFLNQTAAASPAANVPETLLRALEQWRDER